MSYLKSSIFWQKRWLDLKSEFPRLLPFLGVAFLGIATNEFQEKKRENGKYIWELYLPNIHENEISVWSNDNFQSKKEEKTFHIDKD